MAGQAFVVPAAPAAQAPTTGTVVVTAAVVAAEFQVRPLALYRLELVTVMDTAQKIAFATGLDGKVTQAAPPGEYRLRSVTPATLDGRTYSWDLPTAVVAGRSVSVELTNANARVDSAVAARQVAPEMAVYERVKAAVLKVNAGLQQGSAFLLDTLGGIVITNDHVIEDQSEISVFTDSVTRVPAVVVVRDGDADLAVLRLSPQACGECPRLRLALPDAAGQTVVRGERVLAVGFPLHQPSTLTSGIVSNVREGAVLTDAAINPGNSGGPLLNMGGEVIGVNTFGAQAEHGPGMGGAILGTRLLPLLRRAADTIEAVRPPPATSLPRLPPGSFPVAAARAIADTAPYEAYQQFQRGSTGNFSVWVITPVAQLVAYREYERQISKDRRRREARAQLSQQERYNEYAPYREWSQYVGDATAPAIAINIFPKQGETSGSIFRRSLIGGRTTYRFRGDLQSATVWRNSVPVVPVIGGRAVMRVFVENQDVSMKDVAYQGYYVFAPDVFAPDSTGAPPVIELDIVDLQHPEVPVRYMLPAVLVARAWNDFAAYYQTVFPERPFRFARAR